MTSEELGKRLQEFPVLAIGQAWARLVTRDTKVDELAGCLWAMDALTAWTRFAERIDHDGRKQDWYRDTDAADVAGVTRQLISEWVRKGIIQKPGRHWTAVDLFICGVIGAGRRAGVHLKSLRNVDPLIRSGRTGSQPKWPNALGGRYA